MYDWANSAFATIMMAALFPTFFTNMAEAQGVQGSVWWGYGTSLARLVVGFGAPVIGSLIAYRYYKKRMFASFIALGILALLFLAAQSPWYMLLGGYVLANILWSSSNIVYDSYLPDITSPDRMDKVSAWGFAMGYIGGSTIPFVASIVLVTVGPDFGIDLVTAVRISIVMTAVWWGVFSVPILKNVHHKYGTDAPQQGMLMDTIRRVGGTARKIVANKAMFTFILAYFFYIDGVNTVISMAAAYGAQIGLGMEGMLGALLLTQLVAVPCSIAFGRLAKRFHSLNVINFAVLVYIGICITGFFMGFGLEEQWFDYGTAEVILWAMAVMVGTVQGGIQAISRSSFARLVPPENSGEYFGFFEIFGRFAAIIGPFTYATVLMHTGRPSFAVISISVLFAIGLVILNRGRAHLMDALA